MCVSSLFQDLCSLLPSTPCTVDNPICQEPVEMHKSPLSIVGNLGSMETSAISSMGVCMHT